MQSIKKKILGICGSTKSKSTCLSILEFLKGQYNDVIDFEIYNRIDHLPHFNPELEDDLPEAVQELRSLIEEADGILFCTPEYVYSLPGSLKNLIEWNVSTVLFSGKPVAQIIAAASGKKAFESLGLILTTIESILPESSKLLIQGAKGKIERDGNIVDQDVLKNLNSVIDSLLKTIDQKDRIPNKDAS